MLSDDVVDIINGQVLNRWQLHNCIALLITEPTTVPFVPVSGKRPRKTVFRVIDALTRDLINGC